MPECRIRRTARTAPGIRGAECVRDDGHKGDHEDFAGNRWPAGETCRVEYTPEGGHRRGDRIVRCGKPAGHPERLHAEAIDGEFGPEWAADETPAHLTSTDPTDRQLTCGAREVGGPYICNRPVGHLRDVHRHHLGADVFEWACDPEDDVRPAAVAGRADEDVYRKVAAKTISPVWWSPLTPNARAATVEQAAQSPELRRITDAARAPLLAELAEANQRLRRQRDASTGLRASLSEMGRIHGEAEQALDQARAELAEVTRERDEARAILDYALTLRMYGERAPGGNETWREFDRRCETYLRGGDDGSGIDG